MVVMDKINRNYVYWRFDVFYNVGSWVLSRVFKFSSIMSGDVAYIIANLALPLLAENVEVWHIGKFILDFLPGKYSIFNIFQHNKVFFVSRV